MMDFEGGEQTIMCWHHEKGNQASVIVLSNRA